MKHSFCEDWEFTRHWTEAFGKGLPVPKQQAVRLPHTCREVPLHYATPADYEMVCGYRKRFRVPPVQAAPRLFVRFDGAAHQAVVRVNGRVAGQHRGGYTGFAVEITDLVDREGENLLTVQLDTREDPTIPPFGFVIDYLTYGGLYREVWLEATAESRLTDLFVYTPTLQEAVVRGQQSLRPQPRRSASGWRPLRALCWQSRLHLRQKPGRCSFLCRKHSRGIQSTRFCIMPLRNF